MTEETPFRFKHIRDDDLDGKIGSRALQIQKFLTGAITTGTPKESIETKIRTYFEYKKEAERRNKGRRAGTRIHIQDIDFGIPDNNSGREQEFFRICTNELGLKFGETESMAQIRDGWKTPKRKSTPLKNPSGSVFPWQKKRAEGNTQRRK